MDQTTGPNPTSHETAPADLADDLLRGADEIAEFIFGARDSRRKIYYLAETSHLPVFRLGSVLCARRSCGGYLDRRAAFDREKITHPAASAELLPGC